MPLFSEHISNMYYSGTPSYTSSPYSYGSSFIPLGSSYSASYLNPGASYSNHSSLGGYSRTPITSRWIPSGRSYSPMLSTISERGTSSPVRVNSPRRAPIHNRSNRTYVSSTYTPRPVNINTADIDVSRDKYTSKLSNVSSSASQTQKENSKIKEDKTPLMPRVEDKPETGIDTSPGNQRGAIKRERTVVRLHTLKRKERDSPRKSVEDLKKINDILKTEKEIIVLENKGDAVDTKRWREKLSDDLIYKDTREKKTLGEKLIEKFQVKNKEAEETKEVLKSEQNTISKLIVEQNTKTNNRSPDRRCSVEMLAEQACLLDSLIRKENLSTATLDLSKIGTNKDELDGQSTFESSNTSKDHDRKNLALTTTKSDHSLHTRLDNAKDQKQVAKRRSIKKSSSGSNILKLDSITEFPKEPNQTILPAIEESRPALKPENSVQQKQKIKPILKTKITSTVEVTPPSSPLRFKVENITVEEKPRTPRKEIMFSSEVVREDIKDSITDTISKNLITATKRKMQEKDNDPASPEPEDGNFWNKIGKRETVYLLTRKQKLAQANEIQKRNIFWYPEDGCDNPPRSVDNNESLNDKENENIRVNVNPEHVTNDKADDVKKPFEEMNFREINFQAPNASDASMDTNVPGCPPMFLENETCIETLKPNTENIALTDVKLVINDKKKRISNENIESKPEIDLANGSILKDQPVVSINDNKHIMEQTKQTKLKENSERKEKLTEPKKKSSINKEKLHEKPQSKQVTSSDKRNKIKKTSSNKTEEKAEQPRESCEKNESGQIKNKIDVPSNDSTQSQSKYNESSIQLSINESTIPTEINRLVSNDNSENDNSNDKKLQNMEVSSIDTLQNTKSSNKCVKEIKVQVNQENERKDACAEINISNQENMDFPKLPVKSENIPNDANEDFNEIIEKIECSKSQVSLSKSQEKDRELNVERTSVEQIVITKPVKPVKEEKALKPLIATPRPLQKKVPQLIRSTSSSETSSDDETSDDDEDEEELNSSEASAEFCECDNPDGRTSIGSNDSGFDSSASTSPAGFNFVRKDCEFNCHRKCEKLTANLCGVNQRLLVEALATRTASRRGGECPSTSTGNAPAQTIGSDILEQGLEQSTAYGLFRKTGRFTPPARSIPRFRKYTIEDFQFIKVLGKGSFGKVLLAELRDTEYYYAVKCLKKDVVLEDDDVECTLIERKVLALGTNHPYLCHLFATFQTDSHLFFVMEYLNGGDLMFHIQQSGHFTEPRARFYAAEIVSGLKFLHKRGIIYRDLKLDNILLDFEGHVRIADFGMCKLQIYLDKTADTFCGTPDYMAPEIIKGLKYNQTVDWWSFGVLLYEMLIGQSPFSGCDEDELFWSICNEMPSYPRFLSKEALSILTRLLDKDARSRLGGAECMHGDIRDQDFFHGLSWDRLERRELDAPFKPRVRHPLDTQYFDRTFTGERPRLTAVEPQVLRSMDQEPFRGFSYTNPNATDR